MKRDMDLIRKIVLHIESKEDDQPIIEIPFSGYSELDFAEHYHLLYEAGLVRCEAICSGSTPSRVVRVIPFSLTWAGHDFADAIKSDTIWNKAKNKIYPQLGGLPFDVLKTVLIGMCKEAVLAS
ncbi:DUF2513 domain-containing protein [Aliivibrio fischeri]|uniref:DUF2513 domain-containing protein n=1 Tax=Aliivibrio fischeri TaxID=668 RepID=UPI0012DA560F|nr:DUF2513 domain-containing protein [Aliivibrio fischeri]MUL11871.1 DUF2513 domain-containing protein [Aliivibrio fischeri]MUL15523.1 DUF2513 domain-containing protein [Aliivibrio fischeri]